MSAQGVLLSMRPTLHQVAILTAMNADGADFTNTFRALAAVDAEADAPGSIPPALQQVRKSPLRDCVIEPTPWAAGSRTPSLRVCD